MKVSEIVRAIFNSYAYNREFWYMIDLCREVLKRVQGVAYGHSDDGDIIYGLLVIMYGDWGTSPRSGWIGNEYTTEITDCIYDLIESYTRLKEEEDEEN